MKDAWNGWDIARALAVGRRLGDMAAMSCVDPDNPPGPRRDEPQVPSGPCGHEHGLVSAEPGELVSPDAPRFWRVAVDELPVRTWRHSSESQGLSPSTSLWRGARLYYVQRDHDFQGWGPPTSLWRGARLYYVQRDHDFSARQSWDHFRVLPTGGDHDGECVRVDVPAPDGPVDDQLTVIVLAGPRKPDPCGYVHRLYSREPGERNLADFRYRGPKGDGSAPMWRVRQPVTALISSHLRPEAGECALEVGTLLRYDQWDDIGRHDFHWCWVRLAVLTGAWAGSCIEWAPVIPDELEPAD
jgi:hypothetical protein